MKNRLSIEVPRLEKICITASRLCVYLYSLVFFLKTVIPFPANLDGFLRFGIAAFGMGALLATGKIKISRSNPYAYFVWYVGLLAISLVSSLYSVSNDTWVYTSNIIDILFIGCCFSICLRDEESIKRYLFFFSICGGIIFAVLMSRNLLYVDDRLGRSLTGDNTNSFAMYLMLTLFAAIGAFYLINNIVIRVTCVGICILDIYMLMLSGGRKYILVPIVLITGMSMMQTSGVKNIIKRLAIISLIIIGVMIGWKYMLSNPVLYQSIGVRFVNRVSVNNRELYIMKGLEFFFRSPIWGHGENAFSTLIIPFHGSPIYSHDNYIELLTNHGLIGFIWFYYFYFKVLINNFKEAKKTRNQIAIYCTCLMVSLLFLDIGIISYCDSSLLFTFWILCFNVADNKRFKNVAIVNNNSNRTRV